MTETLRSLAIQLANSQNKDVLTTHERALLIFGNSNTGKSSIVASWLGRNKPTNTKYVPGLEYSWCRKSNGLCHIWEFPETNSATVNLMKAILRPNRQLKVTAVIVLDSAQPNRLGKTLIETLSALNHHESVSLIIVAGRYDLFQNLDPEIKKYVSRYLRSIALIHKASLLSYSGEMSALTRRLNETITSYVWGVSISQSNIARDHLVPLYIPVNKDSWENIGAAETTIEKITETFQMQIKNIS